LCVSLAAVALTAVIFIYLDFNTVRQAKREELSAIADLKAAQIANWYGERMSEARLVSQSSVISRRAVRIVENGGDAAVRQELVDWLDAVRQEGGYGLVALYGVDGAARCVAPAGAQAPDLSGNADFQVMVHSGRVPAEHLRRNDGKGSPGLHFDILVPVADKGGGAGPVQGVWLLRIDPRRFLFPLVQSWAGRSRSGETLLVRRDGSDVLFLNELRHHPQSAAILRRSMDQYSSLAATQVIKGREGLVERRDYRDVPTLAAARKVPGTPWSIVVKMDADEAYAPVRRTVRVTAALLASIFVVAAVAVYRLRKRNPSPPRPSP